MKDRLIRAVRKVSSQPIVSVETSFADDLDFEEGEWGELLIELEIEFTDITGWPNNPLSGVGETVGELLEGIEEDLE